MSFLSWNGVQTLLVVLSPFIVPKFINFVRQSQNHPTRNHNHNSFPRVQPDVQLHKTRFQSIRLLLFCAFTTYHIIVALILPPPNIFIASGLRVDASQNAIEEYLLYKAAQDLPTPTIGTRPNVKIPDSDLFLLKSLGSLDARTIYVTYGHEALLNCAPPVGWCRPPLRDYSLDYFLYNVPDLFKAYLITLLVVAVMTSGENGRRLRWRSWLTYGTFAMMAFEIWRFITASGAIDKRGRMSQIYASNVYFRHLGLALLPLFAYFLPLQPPPSLSDNTILSRLVQSLVIEQDIVFTQLRSLDLQRTVLSSSNEYRQMVLRQWEISEQERGWANEDPGVVEFKRKLGLSLTEREADSDPVPPSALYRDITNSVAELWDNTLQRFKVIKDS